MKKTYIKIGLIVSIILGMLLCAGCKNLKKVYWDYDCVWYSETPYIYMPAGTSALILEVDGVRYDVTTGKRPDGTGISFYDNSKGLNDENSLLWETECKLKDDKLYLTIIIDNISDYQGKTIELVQIPYDNEIIEELVKKYK